MKKQVIALEISHKFIKIAIGDVYSSKVALSYVKKIPIDRYIENGFITDRNGLINELCKINPLMDSEFNLNELLDNVVLVLPPLGAEIYHYTPTVTVLNPDKVFELTEIQNAYNMIMNRNIPNNNQLINIIADAYLYNGLRSTEPPFGVQMTSFQVESKIVTLPHKVNDNYMNTVIDAGIGIRQRTVSNYAAIELLKTDETIPTDYFLVDVGAVLTNVSLVSGDVLLTNRTFAYGGDKISERIIEKFNISESDANRIKEQYGIDKKQLDFSYPLTKNGVTNEQLNKVIEEELDSFAKLLGAAIEQIAFTYNESMEEVLSMPIVFIGGTSKLNGFKEYLSKHFASQDLVVATPKIIGGRDPSLFGVIGSILVYKEQLSTVDLNATVSVSREE